MQDLYPNYPQFLVSDATPLAREILKVSLRLASEMARNHSTCSTQEYLSYLSNATTVLSTIITSNMTADRHHV
jgi:hypothetical protein